MAGEVSEFAGVVDRGVFLKNKKKMGGGSIALGGLFGIGSWRFFFFSSSSLLFTLCFAFFLATDANVWKLEPCLTGIRL